MVDKIVKYWKDNLTYKKLIYKKYSKKQKIEFWFFIIVLLIVISSLHYTIFQFKDKDWIKITIQLVIIISYFAILFILVNRHTKLMHKIIKSCYNQLNLNKYTFSELKSELVLKKCEDLKFENYKELLDAIRYREQRWILIFFGSFIAISSFFIDIVSSYFDVLINKFKNEATFVFFVFTTLKLIYIFLFFIIIIMLYFFYNNFLIKLQSVIETHIICRKI